MKTNETFKEWLQRGTKYMTVVKMEQGGNGLHSDIYEKEKENNQNDNDKKNSNEEKSEKDENQSNEKQNEKILVIKTHFDNKRKEIAQKEDENWVLALIDGDNMASFEEEHGKEAASQEICKIGYQMSILCLMLADSCFGFKFGGDEYRLIVYDNKDDIQHIGARDVIESLLENVRATCSVTISIGFTNYNSDDEETFRQWQKQMVKIEHNTHVVCCVLRLFFLSLFLLVLFCFILFCFVSKEWLVFLLLLLFCFQ